MSAWGTPIEKRTTCRYCETPFSEVAVASHHNRQFCSKDCQAKSINEKRAEKRAHETAEKNGDDYHAGRSHGTFFIPAIERGQASRLKESFFCWACHKEHAPKEVIKTLGLVCECGISYIFTIGVRDTVSYLVRVDRIA